ncbi:MAG: hypothetical protein FJW26_08875 [Acidimicrobiia bacterium]|nr:hypothetical protein [Acidimicrobiia bacterium]
MTNKTTRRSFLKASAIGTIAARTPALAAKSLSASSTGSGWKLGSFSPRGSRRIVYVSDPSSIARRYLPDPVSEADLRNWVDELAKAEVDTFVQEAYTQGWTTYWRCERFEYDQRPQHRRFLPLLNAGTQPLEVLVDQSHRRGMEFLAGIRVNDNHGHISLKQGVGGGARFLLDNPQWALKDFPPGAYYKLSTPLDFTFPEVRNYVFSVAQELISRFEVDGLELCFRDHQYFPVGKGRRSQSLMTELVERIHNALQRRSASRKKPLLLGARVYQTLEECHEMGLDVPAWISQKLIAYVAPGDVMYSDLNAPYDEFAKLCRASDCLLYPAILPWSSIRMRRRFAGMPISLDQQRALAQNFYGAGADGISSYNHFVPLQWAPFYPMMLQDLRELRDSARVAQGRRHYVFEPIWGGSTGFGADRTSTGAVKADRIVLQRKGPGASGRYRFRICEDLAKARRASLLFRGFNLAIDDRLKVGLNGKEILPQAIKHFGNRGEKYRAEAEFALRPFEEEGRLDMAAPVDPTSRASAGEPPVPEAPGPFSTCWFELTSPPAVYGDNYLEVTLASSAPQASQDIGIDEIEVFVFS